MNINERLSTELKIPLDKLEATVKLLDEGNTVPFVARYRKEVTGGLDDQVIRALLDRLTYLRNLEKRKEEVANSITEQGKMTDAIYLALEKATILTEVEDIYHVERGYEELENKLRALGADIRKISVPEGYMAQAL